MFARLRSASRVVVLGLSALPGLVLAEIPVVQWTASVGPDTQEVLPEGNESPDTLQFGEAVAVNGAVALAAMPAFNQGRGRVAVFTRAASGEWTRSATLEAADAVAGDVFGQGLAVRDRFAIVSSRQAVYVFRLNNGRWQRTQRLPVDAGESFTSALDYATGTLAVGAASLDAPGAVYLFHFDANGVLRRQRKFTAPTGLASEAFGASVAVWDKTIAVGAPGYNAAQGTVYVYQRVGSGWRRQQLLNAQGRAFDAFGSALDVKMSTLAIGAPGENLVSPQDGTIEYLAGGAVYVYDQRADRWLQTQRLRPTPEENAWYADFGSSVQVSVDRVAVAAPYGLHYADLGKIFLYARTAGRYAATAVLSSEASTGTGLQLTPTALIAGVPWDPYYSIGFGLIYELAAATP